MPPVLTDRPQVPPLATNHSIAIDPDSVGPRQSFASLLDEVAAEYDRCQAQLRAANAEVCRLQQAKNASGSQECGEDPLLAAYAETVRPLKTSSGQHEFGEDPSEAKDCHAPRSGKFAEIGSKTFETSGTKGTLETHRTESASFETDGTWFRFVKQFCFMTVSGQYQMRSCWEVPGDMTQSESADSDSNVKPDLVRIAFHKGFATASSTAKLVKSGSKSSQGSGRSNIRCYVLHPFAWQRFMWTLFCFITICMETTMVSMAIFHNIQTELFLWWNRLNSFIWTMDIGVSFLTAVYLDGELVTRPSTIALQYIKTWLTLDVLCTLPTWLSLQIGTSASSAFLNIVRLLIFVRLIRLRKYLQMPELPQDAISFLYTSLVMQFSGTIIGMCLWVHFSSCVWFTLGCRDGGWVIQRDMLDASPLHKYFTSFHWAMEQFKGSDSHTKGVDETTFERGWAAIAILISLLTLALCISRVTDITLELSNIAKMYSHSHTVITVFKKHNVSTELQHYVRTYVEAQNRGIGSRHRYQEVEDLLKELPKRMKRQVLTEVRGYYARSNPIFVVLNWQYPRCFERLFCDCVATSWHFPDEVVFGFAEHCSHMHIAVEGKMHYENHSTVRALLAQAYDQKGVQHSPHSKMKSAKSGFLDKVHGERKKEKRDKGNILKRGTELCEAVLWTHWMFRGQCLALNQALVFKLHAADFEKMVTSYDPSIMAVHAARFLDVLNSIDDSDLTDLFNSVAALVH